MDFMDGLAGSRPSLVDSSYAWLRLGVALVLWLGALALVQPQSEQRGILLANLTPGEGGPRYMGDPHRVEPYSLPREKRDSRQAL